MSSARTLPIHSDTLGDVHILVRDIHTLELRQFYPLPHSRRESLDYMLDVYFFFPHSFGITKETWDRATFYRHTHILTRIQAPYVSLAVLGDTTREENPGSVLLENLRRIDSDQPPSGPAMTALSQLFGTEIADGVRNTASQLVMEMSTLREAADVDAWEQKLRTFCDDATTCLTALRCVRREAQVREGALPPALLPSLQFAEEYCYAVIDESLADIAMRIDETPRLHDGLGTATSLRLLLARILEGFHEKRRARGYVLSSNDDGEYYSYRLGMLKKELQKSLYVNTRSINADPFWSNAAAGVAAGLAATWSTLAEVPHHGASGKGDFHLMMASGLGVAVYILKDRIKDLGKQYLARSWANRWDHDITLQGDKLSSIGLGTFSGRARERFASTSERRLPPEVVNLRRKTRTVRGASTELEQVFLYGRKLTLSTSNDASPLPAGYGLEEILRLNIADVLRRLDDPSRDVAFYNGDGGFRRESVPKVYHLNIIVVAKDPRNGSRKQTRVRVVLNKKRILRVEKVQG